METSLKPGFAQIFSCCPKNLSCPNFGGGCSPPLPPGPYAYVFIDMASLPRESSTERTGFPFFAQDRKQQNCSDCCGCEEKKEMWWCWWMKKNMGLGWQRRENSKNLVVSDGQKNTQTQTRKIKLFFSNVHTRRRYIYLILISCFFLDCVENDEANRRGFCHQARWPVCHSDSVYSAR